MKTIFRIVFLLLLPFNLVYAQDLEVKDSLEKGPIALDEVLVSAIRVTSTVPVTFTNLSKKDIKKRNLGQDIPALINFFPSVVTTSDAGAGIGYTGIRVRGSDATRINVTINGIPYNDAESQGTFWVNMPDFASSTENLQLQRGVGTSTNGSGAFGASLNVLTDAVSQEAYGEVANSYGSFNTRKHTVKFSTGKLNDHVEISGRLSAIASDGYIDRASSDLKSYFLQGAYVDENTLVKALVFGGHEVTYQSWYGFDPATISAIGEDANIKNNRTYNIAGIKFDGQGNFEGFYDDQVDDYKQDHVQLHWNEKWTDNWSTNLAFHYTYGRGFYEEYVDDWYYTNILFSGDSQLSFIGRENFDLDGEEISSTDYTRRRWLDNDFYGTTFSVNYKKETVNLTLGGGWNKYEGDHFGEVLWAQYAAGGEPEEHYYDDTSLKTDFNVFGKAIIDLTEQLSAYGDLQYRRVVYKANGEDTGLVDDEFNFFNPKVGVTYSIDRSNKVYFSYARANREPNRNDYENGNPKPEKLNDFEFGWRYGSPGLKLNANTYYMKYKDQLVLTGQLNDVGAPLRQNVGDSYRFGLEVDAVIPVASKFLIKPNIALSLNKNENYFFERDGVLQNLGDTNIAYSPWLVASNILSYSPTSKLYFSLLSKYISEQYMGNIDSRASKLDSYFVNDINVHYEIDTNSFIKSIMLTGLINNVFDEKYISNGYFYTYDDDYTDPNQITTIEGAGYYPQAGINFLLGATFRF